MTTGLFDNLGLVERLTVDGRFFIAADADENDRVTGQTSFANTTPTFLLDVPEGTTAIPLFVNLTQAGTVAGGAISVRIAIDDRKRYASAGTSETVYNPSKRFKRQNKCTLYSGATANAPAIDSYGIRVFSAVFGADVDTAEGAVQGPYWSAESPYLLEGPATFLVYTDAAATGPTWEWSVGWCEFPTSLLPVME